MSLAPNPGATMDKGGLIMPLTDVAIRNAKPREKPYKMGDALGLFLLVQPTGAKLWRLKYRIHGREKKVALGRYPEIGLADARNRTREAREQLAHGLDPGREKQKAKLRAQLEANNTFSEIAREYCEKRKRDGAKAWSPATSRRCEYLLSLLSGSIGKLPITEIEPIDVLEAVRRIERQGKYESSRRTMQLAGAVFRYAVATARVRSDPTRDLRGALITPTVTHYGAIIDPERVGPLMRAIDEYDGQPITRLALQLAPHVFDPRTMFHCHALVRITSYPEPRNDQNFRHDLLREAMTSIHGDCKNLTCHVGGSRMCPAPHHRSR